MKNNKIIKVLSISLILSMIISSSVFAAGDINKDETVYVTVKSDGTPNEKIVSVHLHNDEVMDKIEDKSILKDIKNIKGNEKPEINGENIVWNTKENDIFYQGKTDKKLPIDINIKYFLENKEVKPENLAGKSGNVKIVINLKNKEKHIVNINGISKEIYTPFAGAVVVNLPIDKFKNVKINSGKIITDGNNQVVTFIALPGMKESLDVDSEIINIEDTFEITTKAEDFELGPIMITLTPDIPEISEFKDAKNIEELISGIGELKDASARLSEATNMLNEGQKQLAQNTVKIKNGLDKLGSSAQELKEGVINVDNGINDAYNGAKKVSDGVEILSQSAGKLGKGAIEFSQGTIEFASKAEEFSNGAVDVANGVGQIANKTGELVSGANELANGTKGLVKGQEELNKGILKSLEGLRSLKEAKKKEIGVLDLLLTGIDKLVDISKGLQENPQTKSLGDILVNGLSKHKEGLEGLKYSGNKYMEGLSELEEGIKAIQSGSTKLTKEMEKLNEGQLKLADGIQQLDKGTNTLVPAANKLSEGSKKLSDGASVLSNSAKSLNDGSNEFVKGCNDLVKGSQKVTNGLYMLTDGTGKLVYGMNEFSNGTNELADGAVKLSEGSDRLASGTEELNVNMKKFDEEGIGQITNKLSGKTEDIERILEVKDVLVKLADEYETFTGKAAGVESSVKFIIKTDEIKKPKIEKEIQVKEQKEDGGFFVWIKNKISKLFD